MPELATDKDRTALDYANTDRNIVVATQINGHELARKTRFRADRDEFVHLVPVHNHVAQHAQHAFNFTHFKPCLPSSSAHLPLAEILHMRHDDRRLRRRVWRDSMRTVFASRNYFIAIVVPTCSDREIVPVVIACIEFFERGRSAWTKRRNKWDSGSDQTEGSAAYV